METEGPWAEPDLMVERDGGSKTNAADRADIIRTGLGPRPATTCPRPMARKQSDTKNNGATVMTLAVNQ